MRGDDDEAAARIEELERGVARLTDLDAEMRRSKFWRARGAWIALKQRLRLMGPDPLGSADELERARGIAPADDYTAWRRRHEPSLADLERMRALTAHLAGAPRFSVVMPVCDPPLRYLEAAVDSVRAQAYADWTLCIADDASQHADVRAYLDRLSGDPRVRLQRRTERGGIAAATNDAIALADGTFLAFLDHDDAYAPHALFELAVTALTADDADILYSDEDKIDDAGRHFDPYFKPDWSPETMLSKMYVAHLIAYRRSVIEAVGGLRAGFDGSQDYDLFLRASERARRIVHVPRMLYHWRVHAASTAGGQGRKSYASEAALRALREALERRGEPGTVRELPGFAGNYEVRYALRRPDDRVTIVIPTRDQPAVLQTCLESLFTRSTYGAFEVLVVDNGSVEPRTAELLDSWALREPSRFRVRRDDRPFNYSALNNAAVRETDAPYVVLLNNDTEIVAHDWIEAMLEQAQRPAIGAVGALLLYSDGRVQHAGVILGIGGLAGHAHRFYPADVSGYFSALQTTTNYSAVTGACMMIRRELYAAVGGLDESLPVAWNDVDFCLRVRELGYRNVYVPAARLYHHESVSRGYELRPSEFRRNAAEVKRLQERWEIPRRSDPFYSPWLTLEREDFGIRV